MMNTRTGGRPIEDVDSLVEEVERAIRDALKGEESVENIDDLVSRAKEAVRNAVNGDKPADDIDALVQEVGLAVRSGVDAGRLGGDLDSLMDRINKAVRGVFSRWMEAAESVGQSLRDWLGSIRGRVHRTSRDNVVMVRVDRESLERMDELIEAGLVGSKSEAAAFLIVEGIKARKELFDGIRLRIESIRTAREELRRLKEDGM